MTAAAHAEPGPRVPRAGNALTRALSRGLLRLTGWRIEGRLPDVPKMVIAGAPHTSNWDFMVAMGVVFALGLDFHWVGKHTLFRAPMGLLMRALGGLPVDRTAQRGVVAQMVETFDRREALILCVAPEGTRSKVTQWKTGFYHIARGAGVPIVPASVDYQKKVARFGAPVYPTADFDADMARIRAHFVDAVGKHPEKG